MERSVHGIRITDLANFVESFGGVYVRVVIVAGQYVGQDLDFQQISSSYEFARETASALVVGFFEQLCLEARANFFPMACKNQSFSGMDRRPEALVVESKAQGLDGPGLGCRIYAVRALGTTDADCDQGYYKGT